MFLTWHKDHRACPKHDIVPHPFQPGAIDGTYRLTHWTRCKRCWTKLKSIGEKRNE